MLMVHELTLASFISFKGVRKGKDHPSFEGEFQEQLVRTMSRGAT